MAAGGYYGFAGGAVAGPPYSAQPPPAYSHPPVAATYTVQPTPRLDHTVAPLYPLALPAARPAAPMASYGAFQLPSVQDYSYGTHPPELAPQPAVAQNYQEGYAYSQSPVASSYEAKPYYQAVATPAQHTTTATDSYYHSTSQSNYTQPVAAYDPSPPQRQVTPVKLVPAVNSSASNYGTYPAATTSQASLPPPCTLSYAPAPSYAPPAITYHAATTSYAGSSYTYEAAASYSGPAGSSYPPAQHQLVPPPPPPQPPAPPPAPQQQAKPRWGGAEAPSAIGRVTTGPYDRKPPFPRKAEKAKGPPKQPQFHYCETCKISCAGPQTYREHLEGQKHKKKEAALKAGSQGGGGGPRGAQAQLHCELCDISCTGVDAYVAHIGGAKHQKVLKLHTKLGKPIPSAEPTLTGLSSASANGLAGGKQAPDATPASAAPAKPAAGGHSSPTASNTPALARKPPAANKACAGAPTRPGSRAQAEQAKGTQKGPAAEEQTLRDSVRLVDVVGVQPVGHHYIEKVLSDTDQVFRFHCKLCECTFNDPNARDQHLKGRRHRLQYKKKVNPDLTVEVKPSSWGRKLQEEAWKSRPLRFLARQRLAEEQRWQLDTRRYKQEMYWKWVEEEELSWTEQRQRHLAADRPPPPLMGRPGVPIPLLPARRPSSSDDRHVMAKHASIYPTEEELQGIQKVVSHSERALRLVSDWLAEQAAEKEGARKGKMDNPPRLLKGVMRVGVLAKGLLLHGDQNVHLILLSAQRPTRGLLWSVADQLPKELEKVTSDPYDVTPDVEEASLVVASGKEPKMRVTVSLTSLLMREEAPPPEAEAPSEDPQPDAAQVLDKVKCQESLAALRHTEWFQARANGLQSWVVLIRVLRDLCQRVPTWGALPAWALELLVERSLSSARGPLQPGEALRRVLECVASGLLLTDGPGLQDPCEKEPVDALRDLSPQQREDITASSQHALRMLAFRQIHRVLDVEPLPPRRSRPGAPAQKRRWGADDEAEGQGDGKKGKPEEAEHKAGV